MFTSLRQRIFWSSVGSILAILLTVFFSVARSLDSTIRSGLEETVESGARLAAELHRSAVGTGIERVAALSAVPTLRAAVETGDPSTVEANLAQLRIGSGLDWLAVTSPEGEVIGVVGPASPEAVSAERLVQEARFYDTADLIAGEDGLEQVSASGIFLGPTLLGVLLTGDRIGPERMERLELSSGQRVAVVAGDRIVAGGYELSAPAREDLVQGWPDLPMGTEGSDPSTTVVSPARQFTLGQARHLGMAVPIPGVTGEAVAHLVAYRSLEEALAPSRRLWLMLLGIGGAGVLLALGFSFALSRSVTRPIDRLLRETARFGSGDLEHPVEPERNDEIGRLAEGFEAMRSSLLRAQRELIRGERLSALGRASSAIVHDFRQPVSAIQANVQLLEGDWDDEEARREDFEAVHEALRRLDDMMGEILSFARGEDEILLSPTNVRELLDAVAEQHQRTWAGRGVAIDVRHGYDGQWPLDAGRLTRVVENLVTNASQAIGAEGRIVVSSSVTGERLQIVVEDDGPGIPIGVRETLFDPFVTEGKSGGTGLGLAIARSFTEQQGGSISFDSSDAGTRFVLTFPRTEEKQEPDADSSGTGLPESRLAGGVS